MGDESSEDEEEVESARNSIKELDLPGSVLGDLR